jgi:hypothetical protein
VKKSTIVVAVALGVLALATAAIVVIIGAVM